MRRAGNGLLASLAVAIVCLYLGSAPALADPVIAAAGDIACDTTSEFYNGGAGVPDHCRQRATSDLLVAAASPRCSTLGDTQYHVGALSDFDAVFDQTWGRVKPIIRPAVGNHEYSTSNARRLLRLLQRRAGATTARPESATRATTASTSVAGT